MKSDKKIDDIDTLIALVEHAGRDARRQQQLSDMIGQMAQEEAAKRRHSLRLWTIGLAAAASVAGLVLTTVHFINNQSANTGLLSAEVHNTEAPISSPLMDGYSRLDTVSECRRLRAPLKEKQMKRVNVSLKSNVSVKPNDQREFAYFGMASQREMQSNDLLIEEDVIMEDADSSFVYDYIDFDGSVLAEQADNAVELAGAEEQQYDTTDATLPLVLTDSPVAVEPVTATEGRAEKRRGLFRLRRSEPSMMQGTSLSLFAMNL